jgi:hypothetical protein
MRKLRCKIFTLILCILLAISVAPQDGSASTTAALTATAIGTNQIYLSWNSFNSASLYSILRSTSYSGTYSVVATTSSTNYTDPGRSVATTYYYRVEAVNSYGAIDYSSIASATTYSSSALTEFTAEAAGAIKFTSPGLQSVRPPITDFPVNFYAGTYTLLTMSNSNYYTDTNVLTVSRITISLRP